MASTDPAEGLLTSLLVVFGVCFALVAAQSGSTVTPTPSVSTPSSVEQVCHQLNGSCGDCVSNPKCLWCPSHDKGCIPYPVGQIIPHSDYCDLGEARWGVCWMNYKALLIAMGVIAGVLLISLFCCIYCCCCRSKSNRKKYEREDARLERDREEREMRHAERKAERQTKYDEIRKKYGIGEHGGSSKYSKFENEDA